MKKTALSFIMLLFCCHALTAQKNDYETWANQKREQYDQWKKLRSEIVNHLPANPQADAIGSFIDQGFEPAQATVPQASNTPVQQPVPAVGVTSSTHIALDFKIWVVIVGVATYLVPENNLNYTDDDAYKIYAFYKSPEGGSIPDRQITLLVDEDATRSNVLRAINNTYAKASKDDAIIFYFSGHGAEGAFVTHDFDGTDIRNYRGLLLHEELQEVFDKSPARYKYIIADACHSGSAIRNPQKGGVNSKSAFYQAFENSKKGFVMLLSSMSDEVSVETRGVRQGIFSHYLLRGLKGECDLNQDHIVSVTELYDFVRKQVTGYTKGKQNPVFDGDKDERLPIAVVME